MITDQNLNFFQHLPPETKKLLYTKVVAYSARRLPRWAGIKNEDAPNEVTQEAFRRLLDPQNDKACWDECPPTTEGLLIHLMARVDDIVGSRGRQRKRDKMLTKRLSSATIIAAAAASTDSALCAESLKMRLVEQAYATSEQMGDLVIELVDDTRGSLTEVAEKLGVNRNTAYWMRAQAREMLKNIIEETEA